MIAEPSAAWLVEASFALAVKKHLENRREPVRFSSPRLETVISSSGACLSGNWAKKLDHVLESVAQRTIRNFGLSQKQTVSLTRNRPMELMCVLQ